ncbi:MAG TPA: hypothetical protein VJR92_11750 [Gemmatimonadaceae bacterium]|nr:hypothetical protein [Gemmatimonadaceae bacterium]
MQGNVPGEAIPIALFVMTGITMIGYPIARALAKRIENKGSNARLSGDVEARLERMEHAIESIAVEIERISEGQRFTTKLLAEQRAPQVRSGAPEEK